MPDDNGNPTEPEAAPTASTGGRYGQALETTNVELQQAIAGLNTLQEEIGQFCESDRFENTKSVWLASSESSDGRRSLEDSVRLIQALVADTQSKCGLMVDTNRSLATRLDGELEQCQSDMDKLRRELDFAQRCVDDLELNLAPTGSATESDHEMHDIEQQLESTVYSLRTENSQLKAQVAQLQQELMSVRAAGLTGAAPNGHLFDPTNPHLADNMAIAKMHAELLQTKEAVRLMKNDRRRLKSEKSELMTQMREVYGTLEDKERELRHFIRQYEHKMRDGDGVAGWQQLLMDKAQIEAEKRTLDASLNTANDQIAGLQQHLHSAEANNHRLQQQLTELQGRFLLLTGQSVQVDNVSDRSHDSSSSELQQPRTPSAGYDSMPISPSSPLGSMPPPIAVRMRDKKPVPPPAPASSTDYFDQQQPTSSSAYTRQQQPARRAVSQERSGVTHRLSRLLGLRKRSHTLDEPEAPGVDNDDDEATTATMEATATDAIAEDVNMAERASDLLEARALPIEQWKQPHVQAWLQLELGMPAHIRKAFADNVKSGRILVSLTDGELSGQLGVGNAFHRRKIRLAVDEYRAPNLCAYPRLREITWQYVTSHLLPACGLPQHAAAFSEALVDGRCLEQISRKQLDKLGVVKRLQQSSLLTGVDLLRRFNYDSKALCKRRQDCERKNRDLIVWSNTRLKRWLDDIDLGEYSSHILNSGVHGALMVLDTGFTVNTLIGVLKIGSNKQMVVKHLAHMLNPMLFEARSALEGSSCVTASTAAATGASAPSAGRLWRSRGHALSMSSLSRAFSRSQSPSTLVTHSFIIQQQQQDGEMSVAEKPTPSRARNGKLRSSFGRVFNLTGRHRDRASERSCSPLVERQQPPQQQAIGSNGSSSGTPSAPASATLSSTTSDLGSSMERSQHMRTIIGGTPSVLMKESISQRNGYGAQQPDTSVALSASADSAISCSESSGGSSGSAGRQHSPPQRPQQQTLNTCSMVKMRSRSMGRLREQQAGGGGTRPHSVAAADAPLPTLITSPKCILAQRRLKGLSMHSALYNHQSNIASGQDYQHHPQMGGGSRSPSCNELLLYSGDNTQIHRWLVKNAAGGGGLPHQQQPPVHLNHIGTIREADEAQAHYATIDDESADHTTQQEGADDVVWTAAAASAAECLRVDRARRNSVHETDL